MIGPQDLSDTELVEACLRGDGPAWGSLVARYGRLVRWAVSRALSKGGPSMVDRLAADVFQDVFRQLLQGGELKRLRERSGLSAYLTIIATRTALDAMRADIRRQRRYGGVDTGTVEAASTDGLDASSDLLSREREQVLRSMLEDLPYRERTCLELAYVHERTHREIALILGVPQDTVSTVLRRTRERLADLLRKKGIEG